MDLEKKAFERLKLGAETSEHLYNAPLIICYSGGKDSDVQGRKGNNVVVDTAGNVTANTINAVLLLCPKGKRGEKQGYCDRCSQSRKPFTL